VTDAELLDLPLHNPSIKDDLAKCAAATAAESGVCLNIPLHPETLAWLEALCDRLSELAERDAGIRVALVQLAHKLLKLRPPGAPP
jgi:hypothetical protein